MKSAMTAHTYLIERVVLYTHLINDFFAFAFKLFKSALINRECH